MDNSDTDIFVAQNEIFVDSVLSSESAKNEANPPQIHLAKNDPFRRSISKNEPELSIDITKLDSIRRSESRNKAKKISVSELLKLNRDELVDTLEHILASGAAWERRTNRENAHSLPGNREEKPAAIINLEDQRIYGIEEIDAEVGVIQKQKNMSWNEEHGDFIHPLSFVEKKLQTRKRRRSGKERKILIEQTSMKAKKRINKWINPDDPMNSLSAGKARRAMIIRCWQRAMHVASSTVLVQNEQNPEKQAKRAKNNPDDESKHSCSVKEVRAECKSLMIAPRQNNIKCPCCKMRFSSPEKCQRHYYGIPSSADMKKDDSIIAQGCCLEHLEENRCRLIGRALQQEVKGISQQIGELICSRAKKIIEEGQQLSWREVLNCLNQVVAQSQPIMEGKCDVTTIQPDKSQLPIALNKSVMDAVYSRLVDRYANIPR